MHLVGTQFWQRSLCIGSLLERAAANLDQIASTVGKRLFFGENFLKNDRIATFLSRTTLRQIEVIVALRQYGSMTTTANMLDMSVANVSRMSRRFETNLGIKIFVGDKRRSVIDPDAHKIIDCLVPLHRELAEAKIKLRQSLP